VVKILVKPRRKAPDPGAPRVMCGECRYEFGIRKQVKELRGPRRCPRCRVRLVEPGLGFLLGRDRGVGVDRRRRPDGGA
jgi:hypothetical protein